MASLAEIVKLKNPDVVGVPEMTPVVGLSVSPVGKAPPETANVYGATPPDAMIVWLYGFPTAAGGSAAGINVMTGHPIAAIPML